MAPTLLRPRDGDSAESYLSQNYGRIMGIILLVVLLCMLICLMFRKSTDDDVHRLHTFAESLQRGQQQRQTRGRRRRWRVARGGTGTGNHDATGNAAGGRIHVVPQFPQFMTDAVKVAEKELEAGFPVRKYGVVRRGPGSGGGEGKKGDMSGEEEEEEECSICMDVFEDVDDVRVFPCGHIFHQACIDPWLLFQSTTCPDCRADLTPPPPSTTKEEQVVKPPQPAVLRSS